MKTNTVKRKIITDIFYENLFNKMWKRMEVRNGHDCFGLVDTEQKKVIGTYYLKSGHLSMDEIFLHQLLTAFPSKMVFNFVNNFRRNKNNAFKSILIKNIEIIIRRKVVDTGVLWVKEIR